MGSGQEEKHGLTMFFWITPVIKRRRLGWSFLSKDVNVWPHPRRRPYLTLSREKAQIGWSLRAFGRIVTGMIYVRRWSQPVVTKKTGPRLR